MIFLFLANEISVLCPVEAVIVIYCALAWLIEAVLIEIL